MLSGETKGLCAGYSVLSIFMASKCGKLRGGYQLLQVCHFRVKVSTNWLVPGRRSLATVAGPEVSHTFGQPWLCPTWPCSFSSLGAETQLRPRCYV